MCAARLQEVASCLRAAGLFPQLLAVTSGSASMAWELAQEHSAELAGFPCSFASDPERRLYAELLLPRSLLRTFTWRLPANLAGFLLFPRELCCRCPPRCPGLNAGDAWQQGGVFVLGPLRSIVFAHREQSPGWPPLDAEALVAAVRSASACSSSTQPPPGSKKQQ
jgi:hypothetical protein